MKRLLVLGLWCAAVVGRGETAARPPHDRDFWRGIVAAEYAVPAGADPLALARELATHAGDADPEWRDALGYTITAEWVRRGVLGAPQLRELLPAWRAGLRARGPENVLHRAFGALNLALAAAVDAREPFLTEAEYRELLEDALRLLATETDPRGWDPAVGWVHVTAHTADLLKFLVRSPRLQAEEQARVLEAIERRLTTFPVVFTYGEDERLAAVALALARRDDFDRAGFLALARRLAELPEGFEGIAPVPAAYAARRNAVAFLKSVHFALCAEAARRPAAREMADALLAAVAG